MLVVVLAGCTAQVDSAVTRATVESVTDGDTVVLNIDGTSERVRLLGIDTPETVDPDEPVGCYGPEASALLKELLPTGTTVSVVRDRQARDPYGRLLLYLVAPDGTLVNEQILAAGAARRLSIEPNTALADRLAASESKARQDGRGLWSACPAPS